jgi:hypothetical protein
VEQVKNLCVIASILLLVGGITLPYITANTGPDVIWGTTSFGFSWQTPLYGIAALFSIFACLYSIPYIPFHKTVAQWHFWLSLGCVIWCAIGAVVFYQALKTVRDGTLGAAGSALALTFFASIPIFLVTQLLFAFEIVRALFKTHLP